MAYHYIDKEKAKKDLNDLKKVYDSLGITFFLMCGTLLGAIRDKNFCTLDHDIDIGLYVKDMCRLTEMYDALQGAGFKIFPGIRFQFPNEGERFSFFFSVYRNEKIDNLFFFKVGKEMISVFGNRRDEKTNEDMYLSWSNESRYFEPLDKIQFIGNEYLIPNNAKELLVLWYKTWEKPANTQCIVFNQRKLINQPDFVLNIMDEIKN